MDNVTVLADWLEARSDRAMEQLKGNFLAAVQRMSREGALQTLARLDALAERYER